MHDERSYQQLCNFEGGRFVYGTSGVKGTKYTDSSEKSPVWGYGLLAW
jgi:hypothetical protein